MYKSNMSFYHITAKITLTYTMETIPMQLLRRLAQALTRQEVIPFRHRAILFSYILPLTQMILPRIRDSTSNSVKVCNLKRWADEFTQSKIKYIFQFKFS